jgi:cytochrome bd-type quinol oxidase subunit 2
MKENSDGLIFLVYMILWGILAMWSWLHIRSRPTSQEKKKWFDRWCIIAGAFVVGVMCLILVMWKQYSGIPFVLAGGIGITMLNLRNTYYCGSCGKRAFLQNWFSKAFHCPHCGERIR